MNWNPSYALLLIGITLVSYIVGISVEKNRKKGIISIGIIVCLLPLIVFKYMNFINDSIFSILDYLGLRMKIPDFKLLLPIGISFFTFKAISYMIDVYKGKMLPERNLGIYALYISFFVDLAAGPIDRADKLIPQFREHRKFLPENIVNGLKLMLWGYFMKVVVADRITLYVDPIFNNLDNHSGISVLLAAALFSLQIYCDFASYSLIAIGTAKVMGIDLMENFNTPYFARSIKEFWGRWHISLSTWFRDYLYIPLGGNRCSKIRRSFNILVTFLVSGLWHGANFTFIAWGAIHGICYLIEDITSKFRNNVLNKLGVKVQSFSFKFLEVIITFIIVDLAWIFFRAETIHDAFYYIQRMFTKIDLWRLFDGSLYKLGLDNFEMNILIISLIVLFLVDLIKYIKKETIYEFLKNQCLYFRWAVIFFLLFFIIIYGKYGAGFDPKQFIYFQF